MGREGLDCPERVEPAAPERPCPLARRSICSWLCPLTMSLHEKESSAGSVIDDDAELVSSPGAPWPSSRADCDRRGRASLATHRRVFFFF